MKRADFTDHARADIVEIGLSIYIHNPDASKRVTATLREKASLLAHQPAIGRPRPDLGADIRSSGVFKYLLFYRETLFGIVVLRILHGARDISIEDFPPDAADVQP